MQNEKVSNFQQEESPQDGNLKTEEDPTIHQSNDVKSEPDSRYPRGVFFLLVNKFCERFSVYVFYVILTLYLRDELNYEESNTATIFHTFLMLLYFNVFTGALLADAYLAKFWTIFWMSVLFITGHFSVFTGSVLKDTTATRTVSLIGLVMLAISNGGLKPCTSAFGGDQFEAHQVNYRKRFFAVYYLVVYSSHTLTTFLSPVLRSHVQCFEKATCYPLVFGTTATVSSLGMIIFIAGKPLYKINQVQERIFIKVIKCIGHAVSNKMTAKSEKKDHWLDYAEDKFDKSLISDIKALFHILQLFIPLPLFFTLFHQVNSTWVLQGSKMDGEVLGYQIIPDQMILVLPILMIILIASFEFALYPLCNKLGFLKTHLQKIWVGGMLNALSFIMAGIVQVSIDRDLPIMPGPGLSELTVINNSPCMLNVTGANNMMLKAFETKLVKDLSLFQEIQWEIVPSGCSANETAKHSFRPQNQFETMLIIPEKNTLGVVVGKDVRYKLKNGNPRVRVFYHTDTESVTFLFRGKHSLTIPSNVSKSGMTEYSEIQPEIYEIYLKSSNISQSVGSTKFKSGGSYIIAIYQSSNKNPSFKVITTMKANSVHILYQVPQFITIASAEVMFSVTGVAFSYVEAPVSMKAVVQACFFVISSIGNVLLLILKPLINLLKDSHRFFIFGVILIFAMMIFLVIAHFYTYLNDEEEK